MSTLTNGKQSETAGKRGHGEMRFIVRPRGQSWRVSGYDRNGARIREQFKCENAARCRANELESQFLLREAAVTLRPTRLSPDELALVESTVLRLESPAEIVQAVDLWLAHKRTNAVGATSDVPDFGSALKQFLAFIETPESHLRPRSRVTMRGNLSRFAECVQAATPLGAMTADFVEHALVKRWPNEMRSRDGTRRTLSRFFGWCGERPRRWMAHNPASAKLIKTRLFQEKEPEILTLKECARLLVAARRYNGGQFLSYVSLALFAGVRAAETARLKPGQWNLKDGELRVAADQSKKKRSRPVKLEDAAVAWLSVCPDGPIANYEKARRDWDNVRRLAKIKRWPQNALRHTAISYQFRRNGSYGLTAESAGNSEQIIKAHYQGRVSSEDAAKFWSWRPRVAA